ncbi:MAG: YraN family protein [Bacteroidales bacterium]|nr:YraN family protein [Bacteroidales bacterium]
MADHNDLGNQGEQLALQHLLSQGHKLKEKNWQSGKGEIDIITLHDDCIVFTEVKTRSTNYFGEPEVFVTRSKQKMIIDTANRYINRFDVELEARFDIISVLIVKGQPTINHIEDAFYPY